jgi:DNA-binding PadR family transcriptional regulator
MSMTPGRRRLSVQAVELLAVLLEDPTAERYGLDLCKRLDLLPGTVYPLLKRFEDNGWATSHLEDVDPSQVGRPPRRLYRLTGDGETVARTERQRLQRSIGLTRPELTTP